jgi:hypothetical protein
MDPLRPFSDSIRALWQARATGARPSASSSSSGPLTTSHAQQRTRSAHTEDTLRAKLKARISQIDVRNPRKVREAFVEAVLLWDLGERLGQDAGFGEMVTHIAEQLASDPAVDTRLQQLLARLS